MRLTSSALKRTGTIRPLASPFGNFGLPIFLDLVCFAMFFELLPGRRLHSGLRRHHGRDVKYGHMSPRFGWVVSIVYPSIDPVCLRMPCQTEHLNNTVPNRLALEPLRNRNALQMAGNRPVQVVNHIAKLLDMRHAEASNKSATVQKDGVTPAAIAGVQRSVPCRFTKL